MEILKRTQISTQTLTQLLDLWNNEYPNKLFYDNLTDFREYLANLNDLKHLLLIEENKVVGGWAFSFDRENERWFAIIISQKAQGKGVGKILLNMLKQSENELNGWVIDHNNDHKKNGLTYISPIGFYLKNDFQIFTEQRLELEKISAVKIKWIKLS